jgi:hypothetical protein
MNSTLSVLFYIWAFDFMTFDIMTFDTSAHTPCTRRVLIGETHDGQVALEADGEDVSVAEPDPAQGMRAISHA